MPDTFWPDLLVAIIATGFGAILTVAIAYGTYQFELRSRERAAITHLANLLASRRALVNAREIRVDMSVPEQAQDLEACQQSIRHAREAIVEASRAVRPGSYAQIRLDSMTSATNEFLSSSRRDPSGYFLQLNSLRDKLIHSLSELSSIAKRTLPEPGSHTR